MADIVGTISGKGSMVGHLGVVYGKDGKSAYEIAVKNGFEGTEEEWLTSLVGEKGEQGAQGPQGEKGDAGAIKFVVVSELPAVGSVDSIYLVPNATGEDNKFDEYIYQNGAWEKIGSAGVEVNLDEYVKKTDYAALDKAGVAKTKAGFGILATGDGYIYTDAAWDAEVVAQSSSSYRTLQPKHISKIVKVGLTDNKETWTEEEKVAVRTLLGVNIEDALDAIIAIQESLIGGNA